MTDIGTSDKRYTHSLRHCPVCEKITVFEYCRILGHSRCKTCLYHGEGVRQVTDKEREAIIKKIKNSKQWRNVKWKEK